ncbi:MAG: anti-sigma factor [Candidatus Dormibacteraceae bacterium]
MSDHEELENSVAAWALGALEPEEARGMQAHVEGCASCRETADRLRRAVGALPLAADEVAPPARLRARVLAAAAASRGATAVPGRVRRSAPPPTTGSRTYSPRLMLDRVPVYAVAAAVLVALVIGIVAGQRVGHQSPPAQASQVARFNLSGHDGLAGAKATVIDLKADGVALVDFSGLPTVGSDRVYEVWLITSSGRADPAGVFVPDTNGAKVVVVNRSLDGYSQMAITNEQGPDGSKAPSQQPQLYGTLA